MRRDVVLWVLVVLFCFQAEDGIRDDLVTGVQTCALPISLALGPAAGGLALTGGGPPPYPFAFVPRAVPRPQIVGLHHSSTRSRCGMLASIPRMAGLSGCSTVCCIRRNPRART